MFCSGFRIEGLHENSWLDSEGQRFDSVQPRPYILRSLSDCLHCGVSLCVHACPIKASVDSIAHRPCVENYKSFAV
jgi:ferredoxin